MSIKRTTRSTAASRRRDEGGVFSFNKKKDPGPELTWEEHMEGKADEAFKPYSPAGSFTPGDLLLHKAFGKGVVLGLQERRIDVLFAEGSKILAHTPA